MDPISTSSSYNPYVYGNTQGSTQNNIQTSALETSNTDLTQSATNQIVSQNSFAANAQSVNTANQMSQDLLNIIA